MQDGLPVRIGGIAANLARIASFTDNVLDHSAVKSMIEESKWFIEWTARNAEIDVAAQLVELQLQLTYWSYQFDDIWNDPVKRNEMIARVVAAGIGDVGVVGRISSTG